MTHQVHDIWISMAFDEEETRKNGLVVITDLKEMSLKHMRHFNSSATAIISKKTQVLWIR